MPTKHVPLEAVKIMSGFSEEVATAVTQLEWPASEPLKDRGSPMLYVLDECIGKGDDGRRQVEVNSLSLI
jgi:hypothetical protein